MMTSSCGTGCSNGAMYSNESEQFNAGSAAQPRQLLFNARSTRFHSPSPSNCMSDGGSQPDLTDDNNNFYTRRDLSSFFEGVSPAAQPTGTAMPSLLSRQMLSKWDMINSKSRCSSPSCASIRSTASCPAPTSTTDKSINGHDSRMAIQDEQPHQASLNYGVVPDLSLKLDIDHGLLHAANHSPSSRLAARRVPQESQAPNKYLWESHIYPSPKHGKEGKVKASNLFARRLEIGSWKKIVNNESDVVVKFYFAKRKVVWEVLEGTRKKKIEFPWCDIQAMRVDTKGNEDWDTWELDLSCTPLFYSEMDPEPRRHTLWESCKDFTNGEACDHLDAADTPCAPETCDRTHRIVMQKNQHFLRQFQKLLAQDPRLAAMMTPEGQQAAACRIQTTPTTGRKRAGAFSAQTMMTNGFDYDLDASALVSRRALLVHTDKIHQHQQSMEDASGRRDTSSSEDSASVANMMSVYVHQFPVASTVSAPAAPFSSGAHQWQPGYHSHLGASYHGSPSCSGPSSTMMDAGQHQGQHCFQINNRPAVSSHHSQMDVDASKTFCFDSNFNAPPSMSWTAAPMDPAPMDGSRIAKVAGRSIRLESEIPHQQDMFLARGMEDFNTCNYPGQDSTDPGFSFNREQLMGALAGSANPNKRHCHYGEPC